MIVNIKLVGVCMVVLIIVIIVVIVFVLHSKEKSISNYIPIPHSSLVKTVSIERVDPYQSIFLSEVELYDEQNNKVDPSTLSPTLSPLFMNAGVVDSRFTASKLIDGNTYTYARTGETSSLQYMRITLNNPVRLSKIVITNLKGNGAIDGVVVRTINDKNQELNNLTLSGCDDIYKLYYDVNTGLSVNISAST